MTPKRLPRRGGGGEARRVAPSPFWRTTEIRHEPVIRRGREVREKCSAGNCPPRGDAASARPLKMAALGCANRGFATPHFRRRRRRKRGQEHHPSPGGAAGKQTNQRTVQKPVAASAAGGNFDHRGGQGKSPARIASSGRNRFRAKRPLLQADRPPKYGPMVEGLLGGEHRRFGRSDWGLIQKTFAAPRPNLFGIRGNRGPEAARAPSRGEARPRALAPVVGKEVARSCRPPEREGDGGRFGRSDSPGRSGDAQIPAVQGAGAAIREKTGGGGSGATSPQGSNRESRHDDAAAVGRAGGGSGTKGRTICPQACREQARGQGGTGRGSCQNIGPAVDGQAIRGQWGKLARPELVLRVSAGGPRKAVPERLAGRAGGREFFSGEKVRAA